MRLMFFVLWVIFKPTNVEGIVRAGPLDWIRVLAPLVLFPILMFNRQRWLDYLIPASFILFYGIAYWHATLAVT